LPSHVTAGRLIGEQVARNRFETRSRASEGLHMLTPQKGREASWKIPGVGFHLRPLVSFRMLCHNETPTGFLPKALRSCSVMLREGRSESALRGLGLEWACRSSADVISAGECPQDAKNGTAWRTAIRSLLVLCSRHPYNTRIG